MARRTRIEILNAIVHDGVVPVFYDPDVDVTREVAKALVVGGLSTIEFTNRGDGAVDVLAELIAQSRDSLPELIVGAGSIVDGATAAHVIDLGANFVFAPSFSREVARACHLRNVAYVPGCATMTEILDAYRVGCDFVKLFPASSIGGPGFLEAVRAPCPWVQAIPTGGVEPTVESLRSWYQAGAPAVGMGSKLLPKRLVEAQDTDGLRSLVETTVGAVAEARR